jgi:hypothetical protein
MSLAGHDDGRALFSPGIDSADGRHDLPHRQVVKRDAPPLDFIPGVPQ